MDPFHSSSQREQGISRAASSKGLRHHSRKARSPAVCNELARLGPGDPSEQPAFTHIHIHTAMIYTCLEGRIFQIEPVFTVEKCVEKVVEKVVEKKVEVIKEVCCCGGHHHHHHGGCGCGCGGHKKPKDAEIKIKVSVEEK
ncbi:hypothetical protein GQ54DRAFT_150014 [Martensiomyces pterosporus]|nr:hypothetical protein GQ54DRAFT_150014 [Martensiomyces pterosporus]